ncbi:UPF0058 family protein [Haloarchaeobius sp. DFWS5]|uniref:UPF0058 family protein n=1 Tax=Haloarchaeobius sp. DFWS5 TaxID=3446114 RepID=UPI003EBEFF36
MRKQELLHLHQLLSKVRTFLETEESVPADAFRAYDDFGVGPNAFNRQKDDHERAIRHLLDGIVTALEAREELPVRDTVTV